MLQLASSAWDCTFCRAGLSPVGRGTVANAANNIGWIMVFVCWQTDYKSRSKSESIVVVLELISTLQTIAKFRDAGRGFCKGHKDRPL